ncbi:MAG: hypothetical protein AB1502_10540 [Thermodesulfobacteriota bacterium]
MVKFLFGVIIGILIFFFFVYFGGGKAVKKVGEELTDTGKKIEVLEEMVRKERDEALKGIKKKILKEEKETQKKSQ